MSQESHWAVAQTVSRMEHLVRRDIEKTNHGAFLPTYAKHWKVDGRKFMKHYPLLGGYVLFLTRPDDWAGIPDIFGVYRVLSNHDGTAKRVSQKEMQRLMLGHALGTHNMTAKSKFTKYYRPETSSTRRKSRKPRPSNRVRNAP